MLPLVLGSAASPFEATHQPAVDLSAPQPAHRYSVLGRSIVIHENDGASPRRACATIPNRIKVSFPAVGGAPSGSMSFYQATVSGAVTITSSLRSLEGTADGNKWHVHRFPTDAAGGTDGGCGPDVTAGHYNPTFKSDYATPCTNQDECEVGDLSGKFGRLGVGSSTDMATYSDKTLSILYDPSTERGRKWAVGRSIVIHKHNDDRWTCANLGEAGVGVDVALGGASSGTIELFQPASGYHSYDHALATGSAYATAVTLVGVAGGSGTALAGNKWHVHDFPVPASGSCADTGGHYDPMQSVPEYGDLSHSAKHGLLSGTTSSYALDSTLPLHGAYSVLGRSIVIHENDGASPRRACATIPNRIKVSFPAVGGAPSGSMSFYQATVSDAVTITSSLRSLEGTADGNKWHVHRFPTDAAGGTDGGCGPDVTAGHYNPTFRSGYVPPCTDQVECEVGDLSGKFGRLGVGSSTDMATYSDTTLSILYDPSTERGRKWAVGRSIVIHKHNDDRWTCANLGEAGVGVDVALGGASSGMIELFQPASGYHSYDHALATGSAYATAVTLVGVAGGSGTALAGNKWHVHDFPVPASGSCADTGGHYDPMQSVPEYGDLSHSAKHGLLSGTTSSYALDSTLPLHGAYSVLGRSIVIHENDGASPRRACATIPNRIKVSFPAVGGAPSGSMSFYQATVSDAVTITSSLRSLEGTADGNKWHVHRFPTDAAGGTDGGCGPDVTAGHYNPTFRSGYVPPCTDQVECEVGDLSGKFGRLGVGSSTDMATYSDTTLSILYDPSTERGRKWAVGRSIVIHKHNDDRWTCANLGEAGVGVDVALGGASSGMIELFQPASGYHSYDHALATGSAYATAVTLVGVAGGSGTALAGNKWHVHDFPVPASGSCADTGGHYDPMQSVPEYGDLSHSAKHGLLSGTTSSYALDSTLPLHGAYPQAG